MRSEQQIDNSPIARLVRWLLADEEESTQLTSATGRVEDARARQWHEYEQDLRAAAQRKPR